MAHKLLSPLPLWVPPCLVPPWPVLLLQLTDTRACVWSALASLGFQRVCLLQRRFRAYALKRCVPHAMLLAGLVSQCKPALQPRSTLHFLRVGRARWLAQAGWLQPATKEIAAILLVL